MAIPRKRGRGRPPKPEGARPSKTFRLDSILLKRLDQLADDLREAYPDSLSRHMSGSQALNDLLTWFFRQDVPPEDLLRATLSTKKGKREAKKS